MEKRERLRQLISDKTPGNVYNINPKRYSLDICDPRSLGVMTNQDILQVADSSIRKYRCL